MQRLCAAAVGTIRDPDFAVTLRRDGTSDEILARASGRDRFTPLAVAISPHEQLIAECGRIERPEIGRLLLNLVLLRAPLFFYQRVTDVRQPQCPVRAISGRGEILLRLRRGDGRGVRDSPDGRPAVGESDGFAG